MGKSVRWSRTSRRGRWKYDHPSKHKSRKGSLGKWFKTIFFKYNGHLFSGGYWEKSVWAEPHGKRITRRRRR